jgi:hypothetical protein
VGIASAVGAALITRPPEAWVGMRSSATVAVDGLGAGACGGGAGFAVTSGFGAAGGAGFATAGGVDRDGSATGPGRGAT